MSRADEQLRRKKVATGSPRKGEGVGLGTISAAGNRPEKGRVMTIRPLPEHEWYEDI
jgi:hypothetical protein